MCCVGLIDCSHGSRGGASFSGLGSTATAVHLLHLTTYFTKTSFLAKIENLRPCSSLRDTRTDGRTDIQTHADYNIYALCYSSRVKNDSLVQQRLQNALCVGGQPHCENCASGEAPVAPAKSAPTLVICL
jgi:hypothetical protein